MNVARIVPLLAVLTLAVGVGGAAPAGKTHVVSIKAMAFGAVPAGLRVGDSITWRNDDIFQHTATARDASFDVDIEAGKSATVRLNRKGRIAVYCRYHPGMTAVLVVG